MRRERIYSIESPRFEACWALYMAAFPAEERRVADYQVETMALERYHFDAILDGAMVVGFIGWWDFDDLRYVEHFATMPELRGNGYGKEALQLFIAEDQRPLLLEVEPPEDELTRRRIGFYERIGLHLTDHPYTHPSYRQLADERISLRIMTYPEAISAQGLQRFVDRHLPLIHFRNLV